MYCTVLREFLPAKTLFLTQKRSEENPINITCKTKVLNRNSDFQTYNTVQSTVYIAYSRALGQAVTLACI